MKRVLVRIKVARKMAARLATSQTATYLIKLLLFQCDCLGYLLEVGMNDIGSYSLDSTESHGTELVCRR